jgi:hypothetical protein
MDNEQIVVCLTDLSDSVKRTRDQGHDAFLPQVDQFRATTKSLVELTRGKLIKGKGDGDIICFRSPDQAVKFACLLQSYYQAQPALTTAPVPLRVSLYSGDARVGEDDIDGMAINLAARLENIANPGQIIVNSTLTNSLRTVWGPEQFKNLVASIGEHEIKGDDPPKQELFEIVWSRFESGSHDSLAGLVFSHLKTANVDISNLSNADLAKPGMIIWPAVPREVVTAIHRAQIEIIRLLALLGWQVHLLIEDCDGSGELPVARSNAFKSKIETYMERRGLKLAQTSRLSEYYKLTHPNYQEVQDLFKEVTSKLSLQTMHSINKKDYDENRAAQIPNHTTLKFLTPALSIAVVIHLARTQEAKGLVVSGWDERRQWTGSYNVANAREKMGALMHPVLSHGLDYQVFQDLSWPIWESEGALIDAMTAPEQNNLAWWVANLHAFVPAFPSPYVEIGAGKFPHDWPNREEIPDSIQAADIANSVWSLLGPA